MSKKFWAFNLNTGERLDSRKENNEYLVLMQSGELAIIDVSNCAYIRKLKHPYKARFVKGWIEHKKEECDKLLGHKDDDL